MIISANNNERVSSQIAERFKNIVSNKSFLNNDPEKVLDSFETLLTLASTKPHLFAQIS
jgi:GGDEF domain-containing protein